MLKLTDAGHDHYCRLTIDAPPEAPPGEYLHILSISRNYAVFRVATRCLVTSAVVSDVQTAQELKREW